MSPRIPAILLLFAIPFATIGCEPSRPQAAAEPEIRSDAADEQSGVGVAVSVGREEITTVDRVNVRIELVRPVGSGVTWEEPDWADAGWERIGRTDEPPRALPDGRIRERAEVTLEPFLDGDYTVPPVVVAVGDRRVATAPLTVRVASVLDQDADAEMAAPLPPAPPEGGLVSGAGPTAILVAVGLAALLIAWRLMRRGQPGTEPAPSPVESLRAVASGRTETPDPLAVVHHALDRLERDLPGRFGSLAARCERARFAPGGSEDPRAIARDALTRLEAGA